MTEYRHFVLHILFVEYSLSESNFYVENNEGKIKQTL